MILVSKVLHSRAVSSATFNGLSPAFRTVIKKPYCWETGYPVADITDFKVSSFTAKIQIYVDLG